VTEIPLRFHMLAAVCVCVRVHRHAQWHRRARSLETSLASARWPEQPSPVPNLMDRRKGEGRNWGKHGKEKPLGPPAGDDGAGVSLKRLLDESPWLQFTSGVDLHRASITSRFGQEAGVLVEKETPSTAGIRTGQGAVPPPGTAALTLAAELEQLRTDLLVRATPGVQRPRGLAVTEILLAGQPRSRLACGPALMLWGCRCGCSGIMLASSEAWQRP
jgi:hypothetical protein